MSAFIRVFRENRSFRAMARYSARTESFRTHPRRRHGRKKVAAIPETVHVGIPDDEIVAVLPVEKLHHIRTNPKTCQTRLK